MENELISFSYEEIRDFYTCPLMYKFKHRDGFDIEKSGIRKHLDETLHKAIRFFYNKIKEDEMIVSEKKLLDYWSEHYYDKMDAGDILYHSHSDKHKYSKKGFSWLKKFYRYHKDSPGEPIAVNMNYSINFKDKYKISGQLPIIRKKDDELQIMTYSTSRYKPDEFRQKNDFRFTINSFVYRKIFKQEEDALIYHHVRSNKELRVQRDNNDYNKLLKMLDNMHTIIEQDLYYPRISYICKTKGCKELCTSWNPK